ncbi:hypothetical protein PsYK624_065550 [Phanerochaete sordida]|uniref:Uncharacterized protein n=1 Tax=Phanerochaete sordida TaxID=48140 RepID=A0A9P3G9A2_9APHY|nr:hypothetical protein PsYK624_065550 [Phanerochaete sordida]
MSCSRTCARTFREPAEALVQSPARRRLCMWTLRWLAGRAEKKTSAVVGKVARIAKSRPDRLLRPDRADSSARPPMIARATLASLLQRGRTLPSPALLDPFHER